MLALFLARDDVCWFSANQTGDCLLERSLPKAVYEKLEVDGLSTFRFGDQLSEVRAAAAWHSSRQLNRCEALGVLRLSEDDVSAAGLAAEQCSGNLEVHSVDRDHINLTGTRVQFETLMQRAYDALLKGEDRLRRLSKEQVRIQLECLAKLKSPEDLSVHAAFRVEKALGRSPPPPPRRGADSVTSDQRG